MNAFILALVLAWVEIPDTPEIADAFLGPEVETRVTVTHGFKGLTHQDSLIITNADSNLYGNSPFTLQYHLKLLYGDMWRRQAKRALLERCDRLVEDVKGIAGWCDYDPRNLICRPTDCPLETYRNWSNRNQRLWYYEKENVPRSELHSKYHGDDRYFLVYNHHFDTFNVCRWISSPFTGNHGTYKGWFAKDSGLRYYFFIDKTGDALNGAMDYLLNPAQRVNPIYHDQIRHNFETRHSFAVPIYGSYIFRDDAVFEEFSHQINIGMLKTEWRSIYDTPDTTFPQAYRSVTKWTEFIVGMAGTKQDAFRRFGIDTGSAGGFEAYYEQVKGKIDWAVSILGRSDFDWYIRTQSGAGDLELECAGITVRILAAYKWAKDVETAQTALGQPVPEGVARFLTWCRSAAVGRMVL